MSSNRPAQADPRFRHICLLDVQQVADILQIHPRTVWRLASCGDIPKPVKLSPRVVRWRLTDIERFVSKAR